MTRVATGGFLNEVDNEIIRPVLLTELDFPSGFVRLNTSNSDLVNPVDSNTYIGVGHLGEISPMIESSNLQADGIKITLSGIPPEIISAAFEKAQGRNATIWLGLLDTNYVLISDPAVIFKGLIDNASIAIGETGTVQLNVENRMIEWQIPKVRRYTNEDQQNVYPGDKFFEFVNETVDKELFWGVV